MLSVCSHSRDCSLKLASVRGTFGIGRATRASLTAGAPTSVHIVENSLQVPQFPDSQQLTLGNFRRPQAEFEQFASLLLTTPPLRREIRCCRGPDARRRPPWRPRGNERPSREFAARVGRTLVDEALALGVRGHERTIPCVLVAGGCDLAGIRVLDKWSGTPSLPAAALASPTVTPRGLPVAGSRVAQKAEAAGPTATATRSNPVGAISPAASAFAPRTLDATMNSLCIAKHGHADDQRTIPAARIDAISSSAKPASSRMLSVD